MDMSFWRNKRVFITGCSGFKGSWLCRVLLGAGADIYGFYMDNNPNPNIFELSGVSDKITKTSGDIRDKTALAAAFGKARPEIVLHLAAQPIVRLSYKKPAETFETNVMGTVNILECVRQSGCVRSFVNVTTDKVYQNNEWHWGYRETDPLGGYDPYSNSKSCSELVTRCYRDSFFKDGSCAVSTARAGNVIGGGDFGADRIIPDCVRAAINNKPITVRNPYAIRPYQHVLEPLFAYLLIARKQYEDSKYQGSYNIGPDDDSCVSTGELADIFCKIWGKGQKWENTGDTGPHEAGFLKLDSSLLKTTFGRKPVWNIQTAVEKTIRWTEVYINNGDIGAVMDKQINEYMQALTIEKES